MRDLPQNPYSATELASSNLCGRLAEGSKANCDVKWYANASCQEKNLTVCELGFLAENVYVLRPQNSSDNTLVDLVMQISGRKIHPVLLSSLKKKKRTKEKKKKAVLGAHLS